MQEGRKRIEHGNKINISRRVREPSGEARRGQYEPSTDSRSNDQYQTMKRGTETSEEARRVHKRRAEEMQEDRRENTRRSHEEIRNNIH